MRARRAAQFHTKKTGLIGPEARFLDGPSAIEIHKMIKLRYGCPLDDLIR